MSRQLRKPTDKERQAAQLHATVYERAADRLRDPVGTLTDTGGELRRGLAHATQCVANEYRRIADGGDIEL